MKHRHQLRVALAAALYTAAGCIGPAAPDDPDGTKTPGPARMAVAWAGAATDVNLDLDWRLPGGAWFEGITREGWGRAGAEAFDLPTAAVPEGVHELWLSFNGNGASALTTLNVNFFDLRFALNQPLVGSFDRKIVVEMYGGRSWTLFNGWRTAHDADAGGPTGAYPLEVQCAWRDALDDVDIDLSVVLPSGAALPTRADGWGRQGLERAVLARGAAPPDGTYQLNFQLNGSGRNATVTQFAVFPAWSRRWDDVLVGPECRIVGLDVTAGQTRVLYDGWRPAHAADAGGISEQHPVEFVVGWRDAALDVDVDLTLIAPDGTRWPVWRNGWLHQGFERSVVPAPSAVADGEWRVQLALAGSGRTAHVALAGRLLNWRFTDARVLIGPATHEIVLQVNNGVATERRNSLR